MNDPVRRRSDAELDREAEITPADRAIAPRFWAAYGTPLLRALLNAEPDPRMRTPPARKPRG